MEDKVHCLLTEILTLHLQREKMVQEVSRQETPIRSDIFKKFATIDALLSSQDPEWISSKKSLVDLVAMSKKLTKAEAEDCKMVDIRIPQPDGRAAAGVDEPKQDEFLKGIIGKIVWCRSCGCQDDGTPMIGCDKCDDRYHYTCMGIEKEPSEDEQWFCTRCQWEAMQKK